MYSRAVQGSESVTTYLSIVGVAPLCFATVAGDVNAANVNNETALGVAVQAGQVTVVEYLLSLPGIDSSKRSGGKSPLVRLRSSSME
jgi:hypothetical protein